MNIKEEQSVFITDEELKKIISEVLFKELGKRMKVKSWRPDCHILDSVSGIRFEVETV